MLAVAAGPRKRLPSLPLLRPSRGAAGVAGEPTGEAFRSQWIDFERGIRVGQLEPHDRITGILKHNLQL